MIISIKSSGSGGSSRGLVHYLAHSKLDRAKEEVESRALFNESENELDVRQANQNLSKTGGKPKAEELLHIVIAPSKEEIESVGDNVKARKAALKAIVRETVERLEKQVKAKQLKWIAALHFNTDNPHAHLALQKEFVNENGQTENLRITRQMLHYNSREENGEKTLHKGSLILAAEGKLKEIARERQKDRENSFNPEAVQLKEKSKIEVENAKQLSVGQSAKIPQFRERRILAEEILVRAEISRRERNIENLIEHGDKKRFKIKDENTDTTRHVSLFDIERQIGHLSRRKARVLHPKNAEKRAAVILQIAETERAKHLPVINQLETIRRHVLGFENRHLSRAQEKHTPLHNQKLQIEKKYERLKTNSPLPYFMPDEIQQLQSEAIREQNIEKILMLENIRRANALELNRPSRNEPDVQEFLGVKIIAELKLEGAEKRLADFPKTKDFAKVKIGNSHWSLSLLEQHKNQNASKESWLNQIKTHTVRLVFRDRNKNSSDENLDFKALHGQVSDALETLKNVQRQKLEKQKEFAQTLNKIFQAETNPNKINLTPAFSAFELAEVEDLAQSAGRFDFYEKSLYWQENFLLEKSPPIQNKPPIKEQEFSGQTGLPKNQSGRAEQIIGKFISGRAAARVILANIKVAEAQEKIARYNRNKMFIKHCIKDTVTGAERELSLRDVEPKKQYYLLDRIIRRALETKELKQEREMVHQAAKIKEKEMMLDLAGSQTLLSSLENQKNLMQEKYGVKIEITPVFTPKEIAALDSRKYQTMDKKEAQRLAGIITEAEKKTSVERIHNLLQGAAKELEALLPQIPEKREPENSLLNQENPIRQLQDKTQEIATQNSAAEKNIQPAQNHVKIETTEREKTPFKDKGRSR
jgi:hypothetical protein